VCSGRWKSSLVHGVSLEVAPLRAVALKVIVDALALLGSGAVTCCCVESRHWCVGCRWEWRRYVLLR